MTGIHGSKNTRVAIVTGASSGIGEASALSLAQVGFYVVVAARRADLLDALVGNIRAVGGDALAVATDLADAEQTSALLKKTLEKCGRVDLLVNNAGYSPAGALEHLDRERLRHVFDVNLLAGMQLIAEVVPVMRRQGGGRIINMSSLTRYIGAPLAVPYAATKGGIECMSDCLRLELAPWNIQVSVVIPGFVDTPAFEKTKDASEDLRSDESNPYRQLMFDLEDFANKQLKRAIPPEEVGQVIVEAATAKHPKARYYTPRSAKTAARMFGSLPDHWSDRLLSKMYKLKRSDA